MCGGGGGCLFVLFVVVFCCCFLAGLFGSHLRGKKIKLLAKCQWRRVQGIPSFTTTPDSFSLTHYRGAIATSQPRVSAFRVSNQFSSISAQEAFHAPSIAFRHLPPRKAVVCQSIPPASWSLEAFFSTRSIVFPPQLQAVVTDCYSQFGPIVFLLGLDVRSFTFVQSKQA